MGYDIVDKKLIVNQTEAETVKQLFEKYLELQSLIRLKHFTDANNIHNKQWTTKTGKFRGGRPFQAQTLLNMLRDKIYIGITECKAAGTSVPGEHAPIIPNELFESVQRALDKNGNNKGDHVHSAPNLLTGKLFNDNGDKFINQQTRMPNKTTKYYYATRGCYIQSGALDEIVMNVISEFMNANLNCIQTDFVNAIKHVDFTNMTFPRKRDFIRLILKYAIYTDNKLTLFITPNPDIREFITPDFINEKSAPMDYVVSATDIIIRHEFILKKYTKQNEYNAGKSAAVSISENNHLIVRAFARAFRYREMYEKCGDYKSIAAAEKVSESSVYRHLHIAYLNPETVNAVMSGTMQCSVDQLFNLPSGL